MSSKTYGKTFGQVLWTSTSVVGNCSTTLSGAEIVLATVAKWPRAVRGSNSSDLARIIHEVFYCTRRYEDQNSLRYSFFAPGSYKGRSTSQAR